MIKENLHKILTGSGLGLLIFGILGKSVIFPKIINWQIHGNIDIKEKNLGYETWQKQPFPLVFKVYLFNVTNVADIQLGAKPILKEIGPYVYDQYREKINIKLNKEKDTYTYILKKTYFFNKAKSGNNDPEDIVTVLNLPLVGIALHVHRTLPTAMSIVRSAVPHLFPGVKDMFITTKVKNLLFDGTSIRCYDQEVEMVCTALKADMPKAFKLSENGKEFIFSFFGYLNGTDDGPWVMERGLKNTTRGEIVSYDGEEEMDLWEEDSTCMMINGSDSTVFQIPSKIREERMYSFSPDLCRSVYIEYENETKEFGIPAVRYSNYRKGAFDYDSGEMKCFCPFKEDDNFDEYQVCPLNGIIDVSACAKAPILVSFPHFYLGDPKLIDYAKGLNPQKDLHEIYVHLEPITATPLSGAKRVQFNIEVEPIKEFYLMQNITHGVFPVFWIDEGVILPDNWIKFLKMNFLKITLVHFLEWLMMIGGFGSFVGGIVLIMRKERMFCFAKTPTVDIVNVKRSDGDGSVNATMPNKPPPKY